jgi:signal transduction histidine kinase
MDDNQPGETRRHEQWDVPGQSDVYASLQAADNVDHLAVFYDSHEERLDVSLSFLKLGLSKNERCLYASDDVSRREILDGLDALGVDVDQVLPDGQLEIVPASELYFGEEFDPDDVVSTLVDALTETTAQGYDGLRITGEISWLDREDVDIDDLLRYETAFDATAPNFEFSALCQYDLSALSSDQLLGVVQAHSKFVYRRRLCDNPLYERSDSHDGERDPLPDAKRVLETAYDLTSAREAIDRREQRVGVLNRVLRHNLRNDLNVVQSHAELMQAESDDSDVRESANTILDATDRLMDISEGAKRVEKSVSDDGAKRVPVDLSRTSERAMARLRDRFPSVAIVNSVDEPTWVEASEELEFALTELFRTLAQLAEAEAKIVVEIDDDYPAATRRRLVVRWENTALPKSEIQALAQGKETQLSHGSGLGLWLVNWIVDLSGGSLSFRTAEGEECVLLDLVVA